jgi:hypothetical protein
VAGLDAPRLTAHQITIHLTALVDNRTPCVAPSMSFRSQAFDEGGSNIASREGNHLGHDVWNLVSCSRVSFI